MPTNSEMGGRAGGVGENGGWVRKIPKIKQQSTTSQTIGQYPYIKVTH